MPLFHRLWPIACLFAVLEPATAQTSPVSFTLTNSVDWPSSLGTPTFKRVIIGDFNGDTAKDAVVLANNQAVFLYSPQDWNMKSILSGTMNDLDAARGAGPGGCDAIAAVTGDGLKLYSYDAGSHSFASSVIGTSSAWLGAKLVRSADVNATGISDFVGVGADLRTLVLRVDVSGVWTETTFTSAYDISDILLCQWDNDAPLEIACLDSFGVDVYKQNGTRTAWFANNGAGGDAFAAFRVASDTHDHIAWVEKVSSGSSSQTLNELSRHDGKITIASPSTLPSGFPFLTIAASDSTGASGVPDGNSELVIGRQGSYYPLLLQNLGSTPPASNFTLASGSPDWGYVNWAIPPPYPFGGQPTAPLAYADISSDGIPDLLVPVDIGSINNHIDFLHGDPVPSLTSSDVYDTADLSNSSGGNPRSLSLSLSSAYSSTSGVYPPSGANALEIILWKESGGSLQQDAVANFCYPFSDPHTSNPLNPVVPIPETASCFDDSSSSTTVYWLETRYAVYDSVSNKFTKSWESYVACLTTNSTLATNDFVIGQSAWRCLPSATPCYSGPCPPAYPGTPAVGTPVLVTRRTIAPSGNGVQNPGSPTHGTWGS